MTLQDIERFLKENADRLRRLGERRDTSLGFNAFALVSDTYYRENFHSDIIGAILDPTAPHGEGALFLRLFVDFLAEVAEWTLKSDDSKLNPNLPGRLRNLQIGDATKIEVEKWVGIDSRIDIKITATNGTVVIENKIYDAPDMPRQLPRYVTNCQEAGETVEVVVYLTAAGEKRPDRGTWEPGDDELVERKAEPGARLGGTLRTCGKRLQHEIHSRPIC